MCLSPFVMCHTQARCLMQCSKLFWPCRIEKRTDDGSQVLSCLQKAARIVESMTDQFLQAELYHELISQIVLFSKKGATACSAELIAHYSALAKKCIINKYLGC